ncbi:MAG: helix-turn-helix domain-containing protein [Pseudomonadota bacterium]
MAREITMGGRIAQARDTLDLTTAQLARRMGVKTSTLAQWEADRSEPRANRLVMLAGLLNVSPAWLLMGRGEAPSADADGALLHMTRNELSNLQVDARSLMERIERALDRIDRALEGRE